MSDADRFEDPERTSRDRGQLRDELTGWLRSVTDDPEAIISEFSTPAGSGMSSETLLFDATIGGEATELVARLAPVQEDVPVFPTYDLELQFRLLELVGDNTPVPVPTPRWLELDASVLGSPFFVMERRHGRVPADIPPYVFEGWLLDASADDQRRLQDASVGVLADLHTLDVTQHDVSFLEVDAPGETPLRRQIADQKRFYEWVRGDREHPIVEDAFAWLEANWPDEGPTVIGWGDARIGNIMYESDGFEPVAVFDWEMGTLSPPEVDLGWMRFLHSFFQNIAEVLELEGLPEFMQHDDMRRAYEQRSGKEVGSLHWFEVYAALRHAIIMSRIQDRMIHFGQRDGWPDDVDEVIPHRNLLRTMMT